MSRNFIDNKILLYQLFLVVSPYYHLQFPVLHNTHLLKKGEVLFYDEVIVEEIFLHGSLLFFDWSSCFFLIFLLVCVILQLPYLPSGDVLVLSHSPGLFCFFTFSVLFLYFILHFFFFF